MFPTFHMSRIECLEQRKTWSIIKFIGERKRLTHPHNLLPVPELPMRIHSTVVVAGAHLLCAFVLEQTGPVIKRCAAQAGPTMS